MSNADSSDSRLRPGTWMPFILPGLLVLGAAARVAGAWCFGKNTNPDCGIVHLMAKHMAEGLGFPVFFYGQAYMGSLEPATSALLCKIFGVSGFWVCMGTALYAVLCLLLIYVWARDAAGPVAGLSALAYCVLGPRVFFLYQFAPRGGYMLTLAMGLVVLWLSCRIISRERAGPPVHWTSYLLLGLAAGVGWWSNQIIVFALLTAAILFLAGLRQKVLAPRVAAGVLGFFAGSLPFWTWNLRNGWGTFGFLQSPAGGDLERGLRLLFGHRLKALLGLEHASSVLAGLVLAVHLVLVLVAVYALLVMLRKERRSPSALYLSAAFLFLLVAGFIFSKSHFAGFHTARYLVPFTPALAVVLGAGTALLARNFPRLGWLPILLLVAFQLPVLTELPAMKKKFAEQHRRAGKLAEGLRQHGLKVIYAPFHTQWLNFALDEEFVFSDVQHEKYRPYALAAEQADHVGVLGNYGHINQFMAASHRTCAIISAPGMDVRHGFTPPPGGLEEIAPAAWEEAVDATGASVLQALSDRNLTTYWRSSLPLEERESLDITFREPVDVAMVRMLSNSRYGYPPAWKVYGAATDDDAWTRLAAPYAYSTYYWSGPRPYWGGEAFRLECRLPPRKLKRLRIIRTRNDERWAWHLSELQVFGPAPAPASEVDALPELVKAVEARGIRRLYADRWVSNKMRLQTEGRIETPLERSIHGEREIRAGGPVALSPATALLVRRENAGQCRDVLSAWKLSAKEESIGPWTLFTPVAPLPVPAPPLQWAGFACLTGAAKAYAADLIAQAERDISANGPTDTSLATLTEALRLYPNYLTTLPRLEAWQRGLGHEQDADQTRIRYQEGTTPATPTPATYDNGVQLLGLTVTPLATGPGGSVSIRCYWKCPPSVQPSDFAVFIHATRGKERIQADHVLLEQFADAELDLQPREEIFAEDHLMSIPANASPGSYPLKIGLYHRGTGIRLKPATDLSQDERAVLTPLTIEVGPARAVAAGVPGT